MNQTEMNNSKSYRTWITDKDNSAHCGITVYSDACNLSDHLHIGNFWQIKIDGVIRGNYLFSSARMAEEEAIKLIDSGLFP
jgi:hypothetical protein